MRIVQLALILFSAACSSNSARQEGGSSQAPPTGSQTAATPPDAAAAIAKRPPPSPLTEDKRPIDHSKFTLLNPYDATRGVIFASDDGGCHVYVRDKSKPIGPPGSFPPPTKVACPPLLLKPEWGHCLGPGTISISAAKDECICQPGSGDPPGPSFRVPCPS